MLGSLKALDERIFLERTNSFTGASGSMNDSSSNKMSPTGSANLLPTCVEHSGDEGEHDGAEKNKIDITITAASPMVSRRSSLKLRRDSSKKKKSDSVPQNEILNNCKILHQSPNSDQDDPLAREDFDIRKSSIQSDKDVLLNCIKNDTHGRGSRINVRRSSSIKSDSHQYPTHRYHPHYLSNKHINNNHYYNFQNRKNSVNVASIYQQPNFVQMQYRQRRMSSIEHAFCKQSNINMNNFEDYLQNSMKVDLEKSISSINNIHSSVPTVETVEPEENVEIKKKSRIARLFQWLKHISNFDTWAEEREAYSLYLFPETNTFRKMCFWFVTQKWFDNVILFFIALNCITLAMERPNIPPWSAERYFLATANYVFTVVFALEMLIKVVSTGMFYGQDAYFTSGWNIMDGSLVIISIIDLLMGVISESSPRIFGILRVFRLLRSLRPLRVINRAPGLKLVVQTLLSSLRPIGNIVLICCTFFIIFGILGVQLFKGTFYYCEGENIKHVKNKSDCESIPGNVWINRKYNFDDLGKALMSLFVLSSRDGWVNIMYTGLDAVGVDQQVSETCKFFPFPTSYICERVSEGATSN